MKTAFTYIILSVVAVILFYLEVRYGSTSFTFEEFMDRLRNDDPILWQHRVPAAVTAALAGASLGVSGWLLQTLFRNPLAGPSILGITSGSSLMVAIVLLAGAGTAGVFSAVSVVTASLIGAVSVLFLILVISSRMNQLVTVLIFGLMVGYLLGAFQSILIDSAGKSELKSYVNWGLASFGGCKSGQMWVMFLALLLGVVVVLRLHLKLDSWLLGDEYARSLGVNVKAFRIIVLAVCGVLAAVVTAYCGPVAFLGLAMPHAVRLFYRRSRHIEFLGVLVLSGACAGMLCEIISRMPWASTRLPLNAVTSLLGAPVVLWILLKSRRLRV